MSPKPSTEESLFAQALEQPSAAARAEFLRRACADDSALRIRVELLLRSHAAADHVVDRQPCLDGLTERPGHRIGPYKLLQVIGEGGMGVVYMAEQEHPVRRRVALKIIKPGMDSRTVLARFEAERQALALMDHQNIAKVLDAGSTPEGRPYFVMDLVHGVPLTEFCANNRLTPRERLRLFVDVCHAIQHAHQKGIIHRDIKPTNILVTMYDDKPVPKVIDFGVAKATEQRLTEKTLFTQYGVLVGTLEYMSPEQAEMNALGVDTRSDVYSLGVILYELLTGSTPLLREQLREEAMQELVRRIKEVDPPRPSVRLSTSRALPKVAAGCRTEPQQLSRLVRGELDWIVMKCLEKDRSRRYATANDLARDVERHLAHEPVEACPPSLSYRLRKAAARHRVLFAGSAAAAALLVLCTIVSLSFAGWAMRAETSAQEALGRERAAHAEAVAAKERIESFAERLESANRLANDGIEYYNRGEWAMALDRFAKAEETESGLAQVPVFRGMLFMKLGLYDLAAKDYERRFRQVDQASAETHLERALLCRVVGDEAGYADARRRALAQDQIAAFQGADRRSLLRLLLLESSPDSAELVRCAEQLAAEDYMPWNLALAGMAHLRHGDHEAALARVRETLERGANSPNGVHRMCFPPLALALHHLDRDDDALAALAAAEQACDEWTRQMLAGPPGTSPIATLDWLEFVVWRREAKICITGSPADHPGWAELRRRALDVVTYGDAFTFLAAGREQMERQDWSAAAASFDKVLAQLANSFRSSSQEMRMCVEMVRQEQVFTRLAALRTNDARVWWARATTLAQAGRWQDATAAFSTSYDLFHTDDSRYSDRSRAAARLSLAVSRLLIDDEPGYRQLVPSAAADPTAVKDVVEAQLRSRMLTLRPCGSGEGTAAMQLAEIATARSNSAAWDLLALGLAQYRAGRTREAIESLQTSLDRNPAWRGRCQTQIVLAIAQHRLGHVDEANRLLATARESLLALDDAMVTTPFGYAASDYLFDRLCAQVLIEEAEALIAPEGPRTPRRLPTSSRR